MCDEAFGAAAPLKLEMIGGKTMRRCFLCALLVLLCMVPCVKAEDPLRPALEDPVDRMVQRLSVMSQQDEAIGHVAYNTATFYQRGCMPVSIANGVIAAFGVTDRETAIGLVLETADVLISGGLRSKKAADPGRIPQLVDPVQRAAEKEAYPNLAKSVGAYPGSVLVNMKQLSVEDVLQSLEGTQRPLMLVGRMSVYPDWTPAMQILTTLHEMGLDDATLTLACLGAGTESTDAPLRSSKFGHYLTVMFHVGSFMESGTVYVLDSLPRAIGEEPFSRETELHTQYVFAAQYPTSAFNRNFTAARISPTVIRLSLTQDALKTLREEPKETVFAQRKKLFRPLILFGPSVMLLSLPESRDHAALQ